MPWTEPGARDAWLAEVYRRGERLRRRRRVAASVVGALAVMLPVLAFVSLTDEGPDRDFQVTAAGPGPATGGPPTIVVTTIADSLIPTTTGVTEPATAGGASAGPASTVIRPTTTAEVHARVSAINGTQTPSRPPSTDDAVVRPVPSTTIGAGVPAAPPTTEPEGASGPCPVSDVVVTVVVERNTYAPGEVVKGSTTIRNASSTTCLLAPREMMHIEDQAGRTVGHFAYTMEFRQPVVAAPGRTLTGTFQWDQKNCSGTTCVPVPAGTYVAVAVWALQGPTPGQSATYGPAQASFQIGG